jgi:hypothetical protein
LAFDQLHRDESDAVFVLDGEERDDIRVAEPGDDPGLALESGQPLGGRGYGVGEYFDRNVAVKSCITRAIDLTHPPDAQGARDHIGSEAGLWSQLHEGRV